MKNICMNEFSHLAGMREFYSACNTIATSTNARELLVRSHIAYHAGQQFAERAVMRPGRGHSFRVNIYGRFDKRSDAIVQFSDEFDHRVGVHGLFSA